MRITVYSRTRYSEVKKLEFTSKEQLYAFFLKVADEIVKGEVADICYISTVLGRVLPDDC